jgi:predicted ATP-binding protein involved in virulence
MRLNQLSVTNFRCYSQKTFNFHPQFNLIVGQNASGKTAVLDAASVAIASWLIGFKKTKDKSNLKTRHHKLSSSDDFPLVCTFSEGCLNSLKTQYAVSLSAADASRGDTASLTLTQLVLSETNGPSYLRTKM